MSEVEQHGAGNGLEIAIIGMAGRFPGAGNVEEFWRNLLAGVESLTVFSDEELKAAGIPPGMRRSPLYVPVARMIPGYDLFDASFFGVSPREAEILDPQQRLFLESCWSALEDAGYDPERYTGAVGVFAGARLATYMMHVYSNPAVLGTVGDLQVQVSNDKDYLATRVSYKLNLGGPSVTVQTACSTALVAVHLAAQALLSGECDMALAGGVAIRIPDFGYPFSEQGVSSPDGRVRAFDAKAGGTIFGSGLGVVVLKRLSDALADGDTVHAVIKGSAVTNDGSQKVGFTAPGVDGQVRVLRAALATAEVEPDTVGYVEAHGTGTPVGDPIEVTALTRVFGEATSERQFCALGSVKTNIGHLGAAAGVAGLIKAVLALKHRQIPASLLFEEPNPQIDFESSPFFVNTRLREWTARNGAPRRAGVSAFGMGGTNAHVVLEEAPEPAPVSASRPWQLLLLSARSESALATAAGNLAASLANPEVSLPDAAFTLQVGRKRHEHRRAVVCRDAEHAGQVLAGNEAEWTSTTFSTSRDAGAAFLFSGQGAQYPGMGRGLYETEATFREQVDLACDLLLPHLGLDLRAILFADTGDAEAAERLSRTSLTQPALFVVEHALARLWMEWGIVPRAMIGHSIGEYVAACLAGVMSLADALALVAERGRLMASLPSGAMLAVPLSETDIAPLLGAQLSLAAVNAPDRCVVSGPREAVEALRADLAARGIAARPLHTSHAFHSAMMEPILSPFLQRFEGIELHEPQIPYLSNVTGAWITGAEATDPSYWVQHLRQAVRFADGVRELCRDPKLVLLEVGPGQTLATLARQHPERGAGRVVLSSLRHPKDRQEDLPVLLKTLGQLWMAGVQPDWDGFYARERRRRISLPTYPFEGRRFWIDPGKAQAGAAGADMGKREEIADWFYLPYWKPSLLPPRPAETAARWLVFADDAGVGERVTALLADEGRSVVTVWPAQGFLKLGPGTYEVGPGIREDYDALIKDLAASGHLPDRVLHLWNVGPVADDSLDEVPARSFWSLLYLAQALGKNNVTRPIRMVVASTHMQRVTGEDRLVPERALLLGPAKIIPAEYPNVGCVSVDLSLPADGAVAARLIAEAESEPVKRVVAWRGASRWVQDYEAVRLEAPAPGAVLLRPGGSYLITGGLGGLGLTFAEFLAREYRPRLALLGVSALPDREGWDEWLRVHGEGDRISRRILKLRELEALGAEVQVVVADVADREQMRAVVGEVLARFGEIHGVIHTAGLAGGGVIQLKTAEVAGRVLRPKVQGTRALLAALAGLPLDFVVLCSSTIAVAGGFGQVDYCAANNFLDSWAHAAELAGGPRTISINWGAWEEVGMAVATGLMPGRAASPSQPEAVEEEIHPLLDRCVWETADQTIYSTRFSPARHWVLNEHKIMLTPTLPGTGYLELARAAFQHHAAAFEGYPPDGPVEVRDVFFLGPLLVPDGEREVQVFLDKEGDGFNFRVASRTEAQPGREPGWQAHARGKVSGLAEPPVRERFDISELLARCSEREIEITEPVMSTGEGIVYWGPRWQSLKRVHLGNGEGLAWLEMPAEHAVETSRYGLHPALLDVATGIIGFYEEDNYLPLSYRRVRVHRPLPARFYSWLRKAGEPGQGGETLAVDVVLLDETGAVLVEIDHFAMRRIGGEAADSLRRAAATPPAAAQEAPIVVTEVAAPASPETPTAPLTDTSGGILPGEGVEVLRRILSRDLQVPQIAASAKDLHALIAQVTSFSRANLLDAGAGAALPQTTHERPNIPTPYVAPASSTERRLAEIWQMTLGIDKVGVNDNFFDLGGDSIMGIQLIARATEAGLQLSPDQLFEHQTIAELARAVGGGEDEAAGGGDVPLPVTPFQRELLEAGAAVPCWFAVWALPAEAGGRAPAGLLERAVERVVARHDALRARFARGAGGWTQTPGAAETLRVRETEEEMAAALEGLRASLAPESGALVAAAVLREGEGSPVRALLVAHPAAVDRASWQLLLDEVRSACRQLAGGEEVELPPPGTPFHRWLAVRLDKARAQELRSDLVEWLAGLDGAEPLATDSPAAAVSVRLDGEDTRALLEQVPDLQRIRAEELVLAALARTLGRANGGRPVLVAIEADGREIGAPDLDLSRTVGCFTAAVPVRLDGWGAGDPAEELRAAKEQIRAGAAAGLEYGWMRDPAGHADLAAPPEAGAAFTWLGDAQTSQGRRANGPALAVTAQLDGEGLRFDWTGADAGSLAAAFLETLRATIADCRSAGRALYTPSDFPDAELSQEELDKLFSKGIS